MVEQNNNIVKFTRKPHPGELMKIIRQLAIERKVFISKHAVERQGERSSIVKITDKEIHDVLELGSVEGVPVKGNNEGEWKVTVVSARKGSRAIGVATIVIDADHDLFVKTAMWRDR